MSAPASSSARALRILLPAALLLTLLGIWELYVDTGGVSRFVLPAPHAVAEALWNNGGLLWSNFKTTAQEVLLGIVLALVTGFGAAVAMHFSQTLRRALYPLAIGSQAVPFLLVAPLLVFWWGFGLAPKLAIIAVVCFFPVLVTTLDALWSVDPDQLKLLKTLDASRWQCFRVAELPAALPAALSGAKIALAVAVIAAFIAETSTGATAGSSAGLGWEILNDVTALRPERAYAAAAVLTGMSIACFYTLALAERRLAPWAHRPRGEVS
ncbi:MAG TPA: ABC transporter permease [Solirubrobacteraceae bacterium]|jgi:ABC-type nitrate/sulfonate/bicarbonate transport system permease component|nr:ABC transporter permease [Solirubrobacteraceae bacterium]